MTIDISRVTTLYQSPSTKTTFSSGQSEWRDHHTSDMEKPWSVSQGCCFDMGQVTPEDSNKTDQARNHIITLVPAPGWKQQSAQQSWDL